MALLLLQHGAHGGPMRFGEILRDHGHTLDIRRLHAGDALPPDLDNVDGIIALGGPCSANDDSLPWLADEMELIRTAHEAQMPIVGICFGSQVIARALGGSVGAVDGGIQLGWLPVDLTEPGKTDPVHAGIGWRTRQPHWNRECVTEVPPGATVLATSEQCKASAWMCGLRTYAFQYHPEIFGGTFDQWLQDDPAAPGEAGISAGDLGTQSDEHMSEFRRISDRLFRSLALFVLPVDRRVDGIAKALHH